MNISYYGGGWPTNIGNAFIDYGSLYTIKAASSNARIHFASELPRWLFKVNLRDNNKSVDLAELMDNDVIIVSGNVFCDEFIRNEGPILKRLSNRGVKIIFNGCGCATYDETEKNNFRKFLNHIEVIGFISRDEPTYENFQNCFSRSYNGIDCAFFLSEAFNYARLTIKDYVVYNFDYSEEPKIENTKRVIRTHHSCDQLFPNTMTNRRATLTIGTQRPFIKIVKHDMENAYFMHKNILISDIPDDYLNLYANAYAVYSDRVHACVATLSFGNLARLYAISRRASLFERVGAGDIQKRLVKLDQDKFNIEKEKQLSFLREILNEV